MQQLLEKLQRTPDSHKGENGKVLVVGGSEKYTGAPALAAKAALRSGSDLVKVMTSEDAKQVVQGYSENLIVESYGERFDAASVERAYELEKWADATVIGPGLPDFDVQALKKFSEKAENLLIDAEAIGYLLDTSGNIFTPHSEEAEVIRERYSSIEKFTQETGNTVLLKGQKDRIFSEDGIIENETGNPGMTVGGTGDALAGIAASFRAQGLRAKEAASLAAYVNGKAGDRAYKEKGNALLATDVIEEIPEILK